MQFRKYMRAVIIKHVSQKLVIFKGILKNVHKEQQLSIVPMRGSKFRRQTTRKHSTTTAKPKFRYHRSTGFRAQAICRKSIYMTLYASKVGRDGLLELRWMVITRPQRLYSNTMAATCMGVVDFQMIGTKLAATTKLEKTDFLQQ